MKKILITLYNTNNIGGPNKTAYNLMNSFLSKNYYFDKIIINEKLGKVLRVKVLSRLIKEIKDKDPDIILIGGLQLHGFYFMLASLLAGYRRRTVLLIHGSSCDACGLGKINKFIFGKIIEPFTVRKAEQVVTVCKEMARNPIVKKNARNNIFVIHNAIPDINFLSYKDNSFYDSHAFLNNKKKLIYTGRMIDDKGLPFLIDAMVGIDAYLLLVGDGPDLNKYKCLCQEKGINNKVVFFGAVSDVFPYLLLSDIFVFPSLHENLPNSIVEACLAGIPSVATDVGGISEVIISGKSGFLVPPSDSKSLSSKINELINDEKKRIEMGKNAKEYVMKYFSPNKIYNDFVKVFNTIK